MKRVVYALGFGVFTFLVGAVILLTLGTNTSSSLFTYQIAMVAAAGIAVAAIVYWRFPRSV